MKTGTLLEKLKVLYIQNTQAPHHRHDLKTLAKYFPNLRVAHSAKEALELIQKEHFDLIISDTNLEDMSGVALIKAIRTMSDAPLFFLSTKIIEEDIKQKLNFGANGCLLSPLSEEKLSQTFNSLYEHIRTQNNLALQSYILKQYQEVIDESSLVSKTDPKGIITYANEKFAKVSGYDITELLGKPHNIVRHPDVPKEFFKELWHTIKKKKKTWHGIIRNRRKDGRSYYVKSTIKPILDLDGNIIEYIAIRQDITEIFDINKQIQLILSHIQDPILIYLRLQNYDTLQEIYDETTLNELEHKAKEKIERLLSEFINFETIHSLGNGEFLLVTPKANCCPVLENRIKSLTGRLREFQSDFHYKESHDIPPLISLVFDGENRFESAKLGMKTLLKTHKHFIIANNLLKKRQEEAQKAIHIIQTINNAIEENRILAYFQPIVSCRTNEIVKYETLVRLQKKDGSILSPFFFLEIAKKSGLYATISQKIIDQAFEALKHLDTDISINLSTLDIEFKAFRKNIYKKLEHYGGKRIVFEILEDENIDYELIDKFIVHISQYGAHIAIDDFGSGYSNFARIKELHASLLKIDGSLIKDILTDAYSESLVKSIVSFAKEQNIQTIAEFVENEAIYEKIKTLGIDYAQGYYFGKPLPLKELL